MRVPPKRTFLKDLFFNNVITSETDKIDVDIYKGNQKMAAFVSPKIGSITVKKKVGKLKLTHHHLLDLMILQLLKIS